MKDIRFYISEQCEALRNILAKRRDCTRAFVEAFCDQTPERLYLIGSGTSCNAAQAAAPFMEAVLGMEVTAHAPSQLPEIRGRNPLMVCISQGGTSTNILRAMEELRGYRVLALTGRETCRVNEVCKSHMLLACGEEVTGPKTKGYTCTILTLYLMAMEASRACGRMSAEAYEDGIAALAACFERLPRDVEKAEAEVNAHADWLMTTKHFLIVGKGQAATAARECVIKLVETMLTPSMAYEFEEYLHGPVSMINSEMGGIYLLPPQDDPDYERMKTVAQYHADQSGRVLVVAPQAGTPWYTHVFAYVLPCQMMAALLPERMGVVGRGEEVFYALDKLVDIKYGHVV